jgi:predicted N-acetyltransferase YhbS
MPERGGHVVSRELGDDLVLRTSTPADAEAVAAFIGDVLRAQDADEPNHALAAWTRDLHTGRHPTFRPGDCTLVTDAGGAIISCLHLVTQTWTYGGTPIAVGQPELIGTRPEHRGRHLVRAQFDVVHGWSAARGQRLLVIAGIPWFYRQFGYELAIARGGGPVLRRDPNAAPLDTPSGWRARPATLADAPFLAEAYAAAAARSLLSVPRDAAAWRYELAGRSAESAQRRGILVLERDGRPVGYVGHGLLLGGGRLMVTQFEVTAGASWREAWLTALPPLFAAGDALAAATGKRCDVLAFWLLGRQHPLYRVTRFLEWDDGYAFYARVPDVPAFLQAVTPALERRLAASPCAGHSGTLTLGFYRDGVRLAFEGGKLTAVEAWRPDVTVRGLEFGRPSSDARRPLAMFPDLTFLQLLFGSRSLRELEDAFPDCVVRTDEARALLDALFPKTPSDVWPLI